MKIKTDVDLNMQLFLCDAIYNTVNNWETAKPSLNNLVFWESGKFFSIKLKNGSTMLERACPRWVVVNYL